MLGNGGQMFRWHLTRKEPVKGLGQPGSPCSPQSTKCEPGELLPPLPSPEGTPRAWGLQPGCPVCLALAQQGPRAPLEHMNTHQKHTQHTPIPRGYTPWESQPRASGASLKYKGILAVSQSSASTKAMREEESRTLKLWFLNFSKGRE